MQTVWEVLHESWAVRALLASGMVGVMCGVLGSFIVLRNMALVGDALAHAILPGVVFAYMLVGYSTLGFFIGSVMAGLVTAVGITWLQQKVFIKNDAAIGIVFTAMFSIGVIGISYISRNQGVHLDLKDFLFGNVLGVADTDLLLTAIVTGYVLLSVAVFYRYLFATTFQEVVARTMGIPVQLMHYFLMLLLSFAVVASLQTVGVILVVAMLITPASTALLLSKQLRYVIVIAAVVGLVSAILGLIVAILFETTPGPAMALVATAIYLLAVVFSPYSGLLVKLQQRLRLRNRVRREDIIKGLYRAEVLGKGTVEHLREELDMSYPVWLKCLRQLRQNKFLHPGELSLTEGGKAAGQRLVRAHRLWESYLSTELGLNNEQIHHDAELHEHLLPDHFIDEVDESLGFPQTDPHGSPIPPV